jgi:sugar/nucleoside kinase (ribokinase family)
VSANKTPTLVCVGISVEDMVFQVDRFPTGPTKVRANSFEVVGGGNAANAAIAAVRLGAHVRIATAVGDDAVGRRLTERVAREGIETTALVTLPGAITPVAAILVDYRGERQAIVRREERIDTVPSAEMIERLLDGADAVLADTRLDLMAPPVLAAAKAKGLVTMLDGDQPIALDDPMLATVTHVVFSADALRETAGDEDLAIALRLVAARTDAIVGVTDSERGAYWCERGLVHHMPAFPVPVIDTLGAGDTFHAAVTLRLVAGDRMEDAFRFAAAAAALKCTAGHGGDGAPKLAEVTAFLERLEQR